MNLSRRKFDVLVKFLRQTIANQSIKHSVRMQAAVRLDDLLARELHYAARAAARKERAEIRALAVQQQESTVEAQDSVLEPNENDHITELLARFSSSSEASTDDTISG